MPSADRPDVDFVVGAVDPGVDEELVEPPERRGLLYGVVAAAVVALVIAAVLTGRHPDEQPRAVSTPTPTSSEDLNGVEPPPPERIRGRYYNPGEDLRAALVLAFPGVHSIRTHTTLSRRNNVVFQRQITARGGGIRLSVAIRPATSADVDRGRVVIFEHRIIELARAQSRGYDVTVRTVSKGHTAPPALVLQGLARDGRLLETE